MCRTNSCELLSDFVYSFFEHNSLSFWRIWRRVVNCFQILYIRSLNTIGRVGRFNQDKLWIAFRFCIFVLWTQCTAAPRTPAPVVNCFQILYIRSLNTIPLAVTFAVGVLWIAFRFCIFVLWTQFMAYHKIYDDCCELLSDFVYSFFEHNCKDWWEHIQQLWIAFRFCIFVLWTQFLLEW